MKLEPASYGVREALKTLRTNIQFCGDDKQVLLVTSCLPGEGKSSSSMNLARSLSELNKAVLLIDADMRKSVLAARLKVGKVNKGLSHFLSGQCPLAEAVVATNVPKLHMLFSGPLVPNPTELLSTERFRLMLESFRKVYDYIIIDSPPLGLVIDSAIIGQQCDGAIIVLESAKTKYRLAREVKENLSKSGCPLLGVVLNKVDHRRNSGYYGKYYGKEYGKGKYGEYYASETSTASLKGERKKTQVKRDKTAAAPRKRP